jgi:SRSO17 transposase
MLDQEVLESYAGELDVFYWGRVGRYFKRLEARARGLAYVKGLLSEVERKNSWQIAEQQGETSPDGMQQLLSTAVWDADAVCEVVREWVIDSYGRVDGVLVVDETGFIKKGTHSVGVKRQYSGTAGRIENCQVGVFLAYSSGANYALIDRALYLPEEWINDEVRRVVGGIPSAVAFATKPGLARQMLQRAFAAKVPARWVTADSIYGGDYQFRKLMEDNERFYVVAVTSIHKVWYGITQQTVQSIANAQSDADWQRLSCGVGAKGERLYDWLLVRLPRVPTVAHTFTALLVRRSLTDGELTYYLVFAPLSVTLQTLVAVAGSRWKVEECFELAKHEVGLDQYEVRHFIGWYRHITLAMLALAFLSIMRQAALSGERPKKRPGRRPSHFDRAQRSRITAAARTARLGHSSAS